MKLLVASLGLGLVCATPAGAATYTVLNTSDSGAGSLRQAMSDSNTSVGTTDTIAFNITGAGCTGTPTVCTIKPMSALPNITDPVVIDGYTQPGSSPNTLAVGDNAVLLVEIDGSQIGSFAYGLYVFTDNTVIQGLVINRFSDPGIGIDVTGGGSAGGHVIRGNFIGTDPTGSIAATNGGFGIYVRSPNNRIGGSNPADRNVVVGEGGQFGAAIRFEADFGAATNGDVMQGNYIGTNAAGTAPLGAGAGVYIGPGAGITIGGAAAGEGNLISGNGGYGINMTSPGCTGAISGIVIQGNLIGTDATGSAALPNVQGGLLLSCNSTDNQVGGTAPGEGNLIADNGAAGPSVGAGIFVDPGAGTGNAIRANLIYANKGLGIALGNVDPIPNDPGDGDTGPNNKQNFPIISSAVPGAGNTHIIGALHSAPNTTFDLDFFSNDACIPFPHEYLEGRIYLGSGVTTTNAGGTGLFDLVVPIQIGAGEHVTATATDPGGNTSEISQRLPFTISPGSGPPAGGTFISINGTDFASGATLKIGGVDATNVNVSNSTFLTATTPALPAGSLNDVTVTNTDGSSGTLLKGFVADFDDVPSAYQFYSFVTKLVSNAITVGCGGGNYCPDCRRHAGADGGLPAQGQVRHLLCAASGIGHRISRRSRELLCGGVDRSSRSAGNHGRLRQRELLSRQFRDASPDGRLPSQDVPRHRLRAPPACNERLRRRRVPRTVHRLDRGSLRAQHHGRLSGEPAALLPEQRQHARSDGGVRHEDLQPAVESQPPLASNDRNGRDPGARLGGRLPRSSGRAAVPFLRRDARLRRDQRRMNDSTLRHQPAVKSASSGESHPGGPAASFFDTASSSAVVSRSSRPRVRSDDVGVPALRVPAAGLDARASPRVPIAASAAVPKLS